MILGQWMLLDPTLSPRVHLGQEVIPITDKFNLVVVPCKFRGLKAFFLYFTSIKTQDSYLVLVGNRNCRQSILVAKDQFIPCRQSAFLNIFRQKAIQISPVSPAFDRRLMNTMFKCFAPCFVNPIHTSL